MPTYVEITFEDGTVARWSIHLTDSEQDELSATAEAMLGQPDTINC